MSGAVVPWRSSLHLEFDLAYIQVGLKQLAFRDWVGTVQYSVSSCRVTMGYLGMIVARLEPDVGLVAIGVATGMLAGNG